MFTDDLKAHSCEEGFRSAMGLVPMARLIQDTITPRARRELLFGRLENGGKVTVDGGATTRSRSHSRKSRKTLRNPVPTRVVGYRGSHHSQLRRRPALKTLSVGILSRVCTFGARPSRRSRAGPRARYLALT